jgi:alcohol dehydrogenase
MKAILFDSFEGPLSIQNLPDPSPKDHGVVVEVKATGLCRSDWHGWMGYDPDIRLPHVPGHELAGVISAAGREVKNFKVGDRVTSPFICGCGSCRQCASGNQQVCERQTQPGFTHWGSFAEFVALDYADTNLIKIPDNISDVTTASLGCRFATSFRAVVDQAAVRGGEFVAVHGCGGVGLSAIMIANALGAEVIAIDIKHKALELANKIGAAHVINAESSASVVDEIRDITNGGAHVSIDALGSKFTCFNSISCLRIRGRHIQIGLMTGEHSNPGVPMEKVIAHELKIMGSHGMQAYRYPEMLNMIQTGKLQPEKLVTARISIDEAVSALPAMNSFDKSGIQVINSF